MSDLIVVENLAKKFPGIESPAIREINVKIQKKIFPDR